MTLAFHVSVVFVVACFVCQKQLIFFFILFVGRAHFPCIVGLQVNRELTPSR